MKIKEVLVVILIGLLFGVLAAMVDARGATGGMAQEIKAKLDFFGTDRLMPSIKPESGSPGNTI